MASGSNGDSNVCVLLQTGGGSSQEANSNPSGHTQIVWRWQTSPSKPSSPEEACPEFAQSTSTINMRDLEWLFPSNSSNPPKYRYADLDNHHENCGTLNQCCCSVATSTVLTHRCHLQLKRIVRCVLCFTSQFPILEHWNKLWCYESKKCSFGRIHSIFYFWVGWVFLFDLWEDEQMKKRDGNKHYWRRAWLHEAIYTN